MLTFFSDGITRNYLKTELLKKRNYSRNKMLTELLDHFSLRRWSSKRHQDLGWLDNSIVFFPLCQYCSVLIAYVCKGGGTKKFLRTPPEVRTPLSNANPIFLYLHQHYQYFYTNKKVFAPDARAKIFDCQHLSLSFGSYTQAPPHLKSEKCC